MIGVIGLGLVGSALCHRFIKKGLTVFGYDINEHATKNAEQSGIIPCCSLQELALKAEVILLSLPDSSVVDHVVEGRGGLLEFISAKTLIVDTTTADPEASFALATRLSNYEIGFVDAAIVGSSQQISDGVAVVLCGGHIHDIEYCKDLFTTFASTFFHMGDHGKGAQTKLLVNLVLGLNRLVLAEGLSLGERAGIDLDTLLQVLTAGAAYSRVMDHKGKKMIESEFRPHAKLSQHLKDVKLILKLGRQTNTELPLSKIHLELLQNACEKGLGPLDNSSIIQVVRDLSIDTTKT